MKSTQEFLERLHKQLGAIGGEIVIALTIRRITNGRATMQRWAQQLRNAATSIEEQLNPTDRDK
jgi:hypothetical protein